MSRSLNLVFLIGHLTRTPEVKYTPNGSVVCRFSIATNRSFKKADGTMDEAVEYHDIEAWGKLAEICNQLLTKGSYVHVTGELRTQKWADQSGVNHTRTSIRISSMISLSTKGATGTQGDESANPKDEDMPIVEEIDEAVDDMPF